MPRHATRVPHSVKQEEQGFRGSGCEAATRALEQSLGKTVDDVPTSDYWVEEKAKVSL
jgi:hypothetical protein